MVKSTTCPLDCPDRCSLIATLDEDGLSLKGAPLARHTKGFTCAKIRNYPKRLNSEHRIREPWVNRDGHWRVVEWDEALDLVATELNSALDQDPLSVFFEQGPGSMGASMKFPARLFKLLGARTTIGNLCDVAGAAAVEADVGSLSMNHPDQLDFADAIVLWGKHPKACSIHTAARISRTRKRGIPVIGVTVDGSTIDALCDRVIKVRPGCDRFLALAIVHHLFRDAGFAPPWDEASNPEPFIELLHKWPPQTLATMAGVNEEEVAHLAGLYRSSPNTATIVGWGLQRYVYGGENVRFIHALAFLAGTLKAPGGGFYYSVSSSAYLRPPRVEAPKAPPFSTPHLAVELDETDPPVRFAMLWGSNFLNQAPDTKRLGESFRKIPTRVVVDGFWTETARNATVVLPPKFWPEVEDLAGSCWEPTVGYVRPVVDAPEGCKSDFEIARELALRVNVDMGCETIQEWLALCLPEEGPTLEQMREKSAWDFDKPPVAWADGFDHPDKKFNLVETLSLEPSVDPHHPLKLLTHIRRDALHSQMLPEQQHPPLVLRIHPETATFFGLEERDTVRVVSRVGEIEGLLSLDPDLHPDLIACPRGGWLSRSLGVNEATEMKPTDMGHGVAYYDTRVRVERLNR